ncbi:MAG: hypothetical protein M1816_000432 [Peltula sp. TS41687]|nr:MAG: hypothetical protein M1816_000432 [Peltula sp. TS41687]
MDSQQFRKAAHAAIDEIIDYCDTLQDRNVLPDVEPGYLEKLVPKEAPENGELWDEIQKDIASKIMPGLTHWQSPKFMAYFPASVTYPSILGELYSAAFTAPAFNWICSPAVTELETIVMDWLAKALHLPPSYLSKSRGGGVIQNSASDAVAVIAIAARDQYLRKSTAHLQGKEEDMEIARRRANLVILGSDSSHSSVAKAAMVAGTKYKSIPVSIKENFAVTGSNLRRTLEECRREGLEPFLFCATLGTTSTCAVDRFGEIADVLTDHPEIWVHVDAAYAGAALVCEEYQHLTEHFERFHSFNMNMHKWLLTTFDASCLFLRDSKSLTDTLSITPSYLKNEFSESGRVTDYRDWQISLGRRFRALKIWFVMRTYGLQGLKSHIRGHVKLGELFHSLVASRPDLFQIFTPPAFALTVFYVSSQHHEKGRTALYVPQKEEGITNGSRLENGTSDSETLDSDALTKDVYETINGMKEYFLTSTVVGGRYVIRVVSANPKSEEKYVRRLFDILVQTTEDILQKNRKYELGKVSNDITAVSNGVATSQDKQLLHGTSSGWHVNVDVNGEHDHSNSS